MWTGVPVGDSCSINPASEVQCFSGEPRWEHRYPHWTFRSSLAIHDLCDGHGIPVLTDFGAARRMGRRQGTTTTTREISWEYASREQALPSQNYDEARADVYGLGAILYHPLPRDFRVIIHRDLKHGDVVPTVLAGRAPQVDDEIAKTFLRAHPLDRDVAVAEDHARLRLDHGQLHRGRELDPARPPVDGEHLHRAGRLQELEGVGDRRARQLELLERLLVHEHDVVAGVVEVLHVLDLGVDARELLPCAKRPLDDRAALEVLHLRANECAALPRLDVLELDDPPDLAVDLDVHPVLELVGADRLGHAGTLVNRRQLLGERREHLRAALGDDDEVLDPDPALPLEVDPRLDRDDVAGLEHVLGLGPQRRHLVHLQTAAVAEPAADLLRTTVVASIGPVTAEAAAQYNIATTIIPAQYTIPALVNAIVEYYAKQ